MIRHREKNQVIVALAVAMSCGGSLGWGQDENSVTDPATGITLATVAVPSSSYVSGDTSVGALHDGVNPRSSRDARRGSYGNWPRRGTQWMVTGGWSLRSDYAEPRLCFQRRWPQWVSPMAGILILAVVQPEIPLFCVCGFYE